MKCKFYLYGFVFSALIALLIYINAQKSYENQQSKIQELEAKIEQLESE